MMAQASPDGPGQVPARVVPGPRPWQRLLALVVVVGISVAIFAWRKQLAGLGVYGYPGIFLLSLIGNATVILPAPSLAIVFVAGSSLSPLLVGLAAGTGEALGEMTGYVIGLGGGSVIEHGPRYAQIHDWMERRGLWVILILSMIPNPFFDLAGISAGASGVPAWKFLLVCWAGKVVKTTLVAWTGLRTLDWLAQLFH
jgi:membrane protein YqaA with SNARE-associated domain